jgi:hypothetical protein
MSIQNSLRLSLRISFLVIGTCIYAAQPVSPAGDAPVQVLLNPKAMIAKSGQKPAGFFTNIGAGQGDITFARDDQGRTVARMVGRELARLQYGSTVEGKRLEPFPGKLLRVSVEVRGKIVQRKAGSEGIALVVELSGLAGQGANQLLSPRPGKAGANAKLDLQPLEGELPWTKMAATFRLPDNTTKLGVLMYLLNATGEVEWRDPVLETVPETPAALRAVAALPKLSFPKRFMDAEEARMAAAAKWETDYKKRLATLEQRFGAALPDPATLYSPGAALSGPHPRYMLPAVSLDTLRARAQAPAYADVMTELRRRVETAIAEGPPAKDKVPLTSEDPLRGLAEQITPLAVAALVEPDLARATLDWGVTPKNLPLSQQILTLGAVYDWFNAELPSELKADLRAGLIARVRGSLDAGNGEITMWRGTQFLANHNWFHHAALAMGAAVLWGDTEAPLEPGEQKRWMDAAVLNFWIVKKTHPEDGAALEGYAYQDYGLRPYMEFALIADQLLESKVPFLDDPALRNLPVRLDSLLPQQAGFLVYGDSYADQWGAAPWFRFLASRFKDGRAQLLADIMEKRGAEIAAKNPRKRDPREWRHLFFLDTAVPAARLEEQPLMRDLTDYGLYTARSSWSAEEATFFGLRCGPHAGHTATRSFGPGLTSGHGYPEQGGFSFYLGEQALVPGMDYARVKRTANHSLVLFAGRGAQAGREIGQVGEGGAWFGANYARRLRPGLAVRLAEPAKPPSTSEALAPAHAYLCDLGGLYRLDDERVKEQPAVFFPEYRRVLVYLPEGAVVVVDRVQSALARDFVFRLLLGTKDLAPVAAKTGAAAGPMAFSGKLGDEAVKVVNYSAPGLVATVASEMMPSWGRKDRQVVKIAAKKQTAAVFAVALGRAAVVDGLRVEADEIRIRISRTGGAPLEYGWEDAALTALMGAKEE